MTVIKGKEPTPLPTEPENSPQWPTVELDHDVRLMQPVLLGEVAECHNVEIIQELIKFAINMQKLAQASGAKTAKATPAPSGAAERGGQQSEGAAASSAQKPKRTEEDAALGTKEAANADPMEGVTTGGPPAKA